MDRKSAEEISRLFSKASALCNASLRTVMSNEGLGHVQVYGRLVGEFMGHSYTNILAPIWKKFPDLEPAEMKAPHVEPQPTLSRESQEALQSFLVEARSALGFANGTNSPDKVSEEDFAYGALVEVEKSIEEIALFLARPRVQDEGCDDA
jgi:hypothetical protein